MRLELYIPGHVGPSQERAGLPSRVIWHRQAAASGGTASGAVASRHGKRAVDSFFRGFAAAFIGLRRTAGGELRELVVT